VTQILYFVNQGSPVFAYGPEGESQLIVGFDEYNILLYDFETKTTYRKGLADSEEFFTQAGSRFVSYLAE
jgi:hypothetical protein